MSEFIQNAKTAVGVYKLAIFYGILFSINALTSAIIASFMNVSWNELGATSRFLLIAVVLQNWTGVMLAFFSKTIARIEQGQPPIQTGDTQFLKQQPPTTSTSTKI